MLSFASINFTYRYTVCHCIKPAYYNILGSCAESRMAFSFATLLFLLLAMHMSESFFFGGPRRSFWGREATKMAILGGTADSGRNLQFKAPTDGAMLCYDLYKVKTPNGPPIVFLPGLIRQKNEIKATNLQSWCRKNSLTFFCADYMGVGRSSGKFSDGTVGRWATDTITLIDNVITTNQGKVILVGHGVGAWISFLVAAKRPDLVSGIVGLSADPDFTEELLWKKLPEDVKSKIMSDGVAEIQWGAEKYPISRALIEDGRKNLLLTGGPASIPVQCPVRVVHAMDDEEVPFQLALKLVDNCASNDASVVLVKGSSHSMDREQDFKTMRSMIVEVIEAFKGEFDLRSPGSG